MHAFLTVPRYIFHAGEISICTPAGTVTEPLWIGVEVDEPLRMAMLEYLSRRGHELIPADGLTPDELRSVGIDHFEAISMLP